MGREIGREGRKEGERGREGREGSSGREEGWRRERRKESLQYKHTQRI